MTAVHALRVVRAFVAVGLLNLVQYRSDFVIVLLNSVIGTAAQVAGIVVIFSNTSDLKGWTAADLVVLVGVQAVLRGFITALVQPSLEAMMEGIRLGTFDFLLTKPADAQVLASSQVVAPHALTDVMVGGIVIGAGLSRAGHGVDAASLALVPPVLIAGLVIVYSFLLMLSTMAFWFVKLENVLMIFQILFSNAGRWPVTVFPQWMRFILTFVVPVAFAVTVPAQALTGRISWAGAAFAVVVAALFVLASRAMWRIGLRRYTGASA